MIKFFHHLFNPHCLDCKEDLLDSKVCESCNMLQQQIAALRKHNDQLIEALLESVKPVHEVKVEQPIIMQEPVNKNLPWRARRQILEQEDRVAAKIKREKDKEMAAIPVVPVTELEKELEIANG